jgi:glutamate synthase (NADPH/NADH) large chain
MLQRSKEQLEAAQRDRAVSEKEVGAVVADLKQATDNLAQKSQARSVMERRIEQMCVEVDAALDGGAMFVVLSDRDSDKDLAPIPSLLMLSAINNHLIRSGRRMQSSLIVEAGDVREVHHVATLIGFGASAVNPYLAMETAELLVRTGRVTGVTPEKAVTNIIYGLGKGVLKTMSKMGISTVASYAAAQAFEAVGLSQEFVDRYFTGVTSILGGVSMDIIAEAADTEVLLQPFSSISTERYAPKA